MRHFSIAAAALCFWACGPVFAQVGMVTGAPAPLGVTSPLGIGPGALVGATGIPLGATELATPGLSPSAAGTAALGSMTASTACSGIGASAQPTTSIPGTSGMAASPTPNAMTTTGAMTSGTPAPTPLFDSTGISGNASGTCASGTATASSSATASASSPAGLGSRSTTVGRAGVAMGSTELSPGGLSPLPDITLPSQPSASTMGTSTSPCVLTGSSPTTATSMSSAGC
jgi:hypothetical protein